MLLAGFAQILAGIGMAQCLAGLNAVRRFAKSPLAQHQGDWPPVTVLKPLCGNEPLLEEALESCFLQDYPRFQIVFGVQDPADPALAVVEKLRRRYPDCDVVLVIDSSMHGPNRKISNLINMLPQASHDILVISDSDLHLPRSYLRCQVAALQVPGTGLVTALYVGAPAPESGWPAQMGATGISHGFLPGVLMSRSMGRQDCLGSTAMFTRDTLERTGGFHPLVEVLAEDNVFGQRVRELGLSIALADVIPAATVPEPTLPQLWQHELRWTRTIRELAPASLCASMLQYPLFWSALAMLLAPGEAIGMTIFLLAWLVRIGCAYAIDEALKDRVGRRAAPVPVWLIPLRDLLSVCEIIASFCVNQVVWRGHRMDACGVATAPVKTNCPFEAPRQTPGDVH